MKNHEFSLTVCNQPDEDLFQKQCAAIEKHIPNLKKDSLLEDVDGSSYQKYHHEKGDITVSNDYYVGCLYVDADFDLLPYFKKSA